MVRLWVALVLLGGGAGDEDKKDAAKKVLEEFRSAVREACGFAEKALLIQGLGRSDARSSCMIPALGRYLNPNPADLHCLLPTTTAETLGRFRGDKAAAQLLIQVLPVYKKNPYMTRRLIQALGRVGHESVLPTLEEYLAGLDLDLAAVAVEAVVEMPPAASMEGLMRAWEILEDKKSKSLDAAKPLYDRHLAAILKAVKKLSGEGYVTMQEYRIWWKKRGEEFKAKHRNRLDLPPARTGLPPVLLVELLFNDKGLGQPVNTGATCSLFPAGKLTSGLFYSDLVPAGGGSASLDWGTRPAPLAADLGGVVEPLKNLKSFTIAGWLNCRAAGEGTGGNRVVTWSNNGGDGVDLAYRADGSLQLGVNQWADGSAARSAAGQVPVLPDKPADAIAGNWRFFAVTYDSTVPQGHVKFYFGPRNADAKLVTTCDYARGPVGPKIGPNLSIGNVNLASRPMGFDRMFRGLIDEIRIFGSLHDGAAALPLPDLLALQAREGP